MGFPGATRSPCSRRHRCTSVGARPRSRARAKGAFCSPEMWRRWIVAPSASPFQRAVSPENELRRPVSTAADTAPLSSTSRAGSSEPARRRGGRPQSSRTAALAPLAATVEERRSNVSIRPAAASSRYARSTVDWAMPRSAASVRALGSAAPGASSPAAMREASAWVRSAYSGTSGHKDGTWRSRPERDTLPSAPSQNRVRRIECPASARSYSPPRSHSCSCRAFQRSRTP